MDIHVEVHVNAISWDISKWNLEIEPRFLYTVDMLNSDMYSQKQTYYLYDEQRN